MEVFRSDFEQYAFLLRTPLSFVSSPSGTSQPGRPGISAMRDQIHKKLLKRGFEFNVMVVGEAGLGKSTLIDTLFCVRSSLISFYECRAACICARSPHTSTSPKHFQPQGKVSRRSCSDGAIEPLPSTVDIGSISHGQRSTGSKSWIASSFLTYLTAMTIPLPQLLRRTMSE